MNARKTFNFDLIAIFALVTACFALASPAAAYDPEVGDFSKSADDLVRVVTYNIERRFVAEPASDEAFARVLLALRPDVIIFEEIVPEVTDEQIAERLNSVLADLSTQWHVYSGTGSYIHNVIASRYPLSMLRQDTDPPSDSRGVTMALVDLPDDVFSADLYLMGVHLKCCNGGRGEQARRQKSVDAMLSWIGKGRDGNEENFELAPGTAIIALGDFNFVGGPAAVPPLDNFLAGDIIDEAAYGADVAADWDGSAMTNLLAVDPLSGANFTWQGNGQYPPGQLDRIIYSDSVMEIAESFVLNTNSMNAAQLGAAGLEATDTNIGVTSDHLPFVMDFRVTGPGD